MIFTRKYKGTNIMKTLTKITAAIAIAALGAGAAAAQDRLGNPGDPVWGCVTEGAVKIVSSAQAENRLQSVRGVFNEQCAMIAGANFQVVDSGFFVSEVMIYSDGGSANLFVHSGLILDYRKRN